MSTRVKTWLVFVRDVGDSHVAFVQRYGFWPTKKRGIFWHRFDSPEHAKHAIQPFIAAGLHGVIQNKWRSTPARDQERAAIDLWLATKQPTLLPPAEAKYTYDATISRRTPSHVIRTRFFGKRAKPRK